MASPSIAFPFAAPTALPQLPLALSRPMLLALPSSCIALGIVLLGYSTIFHQHTRRTFWRYRGGEVRLVLTAHALSGLLEILRFHSLSLSAPPIPTTLDLLLCLVQSLTNLTLVRPLRRGQPSLVRPSYQAGALLRPLVSFLAWRSGSPALHAASVGIVHGFLYTRVLIWLLGTTGLLEKYADVYTVAVFVAGIVACADGPVRHLEKVYIAVVAGVALANRWTTEQLRSEVYDAHSPAMRQLLELLVLLGFANLETIRERAGARATQPSMAPISVKTRDQPAIASERDEYWAPSPVVATVLPTPSMAACEPSCMRSPSNSLPTPPMSPVNLSLKTPSYTSISSFPVF
ncbi:hypothetical protein CALVIDRAFT_596813 [Calocera viscosa TUFC12733]|uniref:Uncharacterized protein n=1 Tax=Calocera viscosa (strain TUFC12733) TaxID=1330018 RepID=A0A167NZP6_CALVF|nr:hypothetical protein CALVIDRAFT_596813 [Calocera viscosa TUFC12733]